MLPILKFFVIYFFVNIVHGNFAHPFKAFHAVAHAFREVFLLLTKIQTPVCLLICLSTGNTGTI